MCQSVQMQRLHVFYHILVVLGQWQGVGVLIMMVGPLGALGEALVEWVREVLPFQRLGEAAGSILDLELPAEVSLASSGCSMDTEGASRVDFEVSGQVARRVGAEAAPVDRLLG